jgi:osmotically-inducible protein OsmY
MLRNPSFRRRSLLAGALVAFLASGPAWAQSDPQPETTADQQKSNRTDRDLTQQIRKAVIADKSLSTYGHNVKIISQHGAVTLKGPVRSEEEKKIIVARAEEIAGQGKVTDQLTVKPAK